MKKILIVEDEDHIAELVSAIFADLRRYEILIAGDGAEALQITRKHNPDIILLDIKMPGMNGYEVCETVKSEPLLYRTKVLMLSGLMQSSDYQKALEAGADGYVTKPFDPIELVKRVEALLNSG